ncbi:unnamed protein product, partial [Heterosigma akashiwo]
SPPASCRTPSGSGWRARTTRGSSLTSSSQPQNCRFKFLPLKKVAEQAVGPIHCSHDNQSVGCLVLHLFTVYICFFIPAAVVIVVVFRVCHSKNSTLQQCCILILFDLYTFFLFRVISRALLQT